MKKEIIKSIEEEAVVKNSHEPLVRIKEHLLRSFPLVVLKERDLSIKSPYVFSTLAYKRPVGVSKMASAEVEIFSPAGDVINEKIYFEFDYSELDRIEDAKKPSSYNIRPEVLYMRKHDNFSPDDFECAYSDVIIKKVKLLGKDEKGAQEVQLNCEFDNSFYNKGEARFAVVVKLSSTFEELELAKAETETIQINVRRMRDSEVQFGAKRLVADLEHFSINPTFLKGSPPVIVNSSVILPRPYIRVVKIEYLPPIDVDSVTAQLIVEYDYNGRTHSERVSFDFVQSIRQAAESLIRQESTVNYRYLPKLRRVPPVHMDELDFAYDGDIPLKIVGVEYKHEEIDPDNRFVNATLFVQYRTCIIRVIKRLEFQYSHNEYINGSWIHARNENGSIIFDKEFISPKNFYPKVDPIEGTYTKPAELIKNATISSDYPYVDIIEMKLINFDISSRVMMFKVVVLEKHGAKTFERKFEKHVVMKWSYEEWRLGEITAKDLIINEVVLPDCPTQTIDEEVFVKSDQFEILSVQYIYPGDDEKEMDMQVQLVAGERSRFITKKLEFKMTYNESIKEIETWEIINTLRSLQPKDITLLVNLDGQAPDSIEPEKVIGIPSGVEVRVHYKPPRSGEKSTRIVLEFSRGKFTAGFEQTLMFARES